MFILVCFDDSCVYVLVTSVVFLAGLRELTKHMFSNNKNMRRVTGLTYAAVVREGPKRPDCPVLTDIEFDKMYYAEKRRKRKYARRHANLVTQWSTKIIDAHQKRHE